MKHLDVIKIEYFDIILVTQILVPQRKRARQTILQQITLLENMEKQIHFTLHSPNNPYLSRVKLCLQLCSGTVDLFFLLKILPGSNNTILSQAEYHIMFLKQLLVQKS